MRADSHRSTGPAARSRSDRRLHSATTRPASRWQSATCFVLRPRLRRWSTYSASDSAAGVVSQSRTASSVAVTTPARTFSARSISPRRTACAASFVRQPVETSRTTPAPSRYLAT
ncbi:hypothetical protein [Botrimarina sp.]|uniref:hypothetical protein n=1 Tax=Botrimarina sp. TaxID=2795802 RepID=UPI0032EF9576